MRKITLNFDGACEPFNPGGNMGFGYLIKEDGFVLYSGNGFEPQNPYNTNNVAEYRALCLGLKWLIDQGLKDEQVEVYGDSALVINQMSGLWRAKGGLYYKDYLVAKDLVALFSNITFTWVRRDGNTEADTLSKSHL